MYREKKEENLMSKVYIVGAKRTPVGSMHGTLKDYNLGELGALVIKQLLKDANIEGKDIDEVVMGNIYSAGLGGNVSRQAAVKADIPVEVPAYALNMLCGSGMKAVINSYLSITGGMNQAVVAGGLESMSGAPYLIPGRIKNGIKMGEIEVEDHMLKDGLIDAFHNYHMGVTAENIAEKHHITREEQDAFALESQKRATKAQEAGEFEAEIVPVTIKTRKGETVFDKDEYIKPSTTIETLQKLRPAFKKDGGVTAGNASGINDAASATIIASEEFVNEKGIKPLVEIIGVGQAGVEPSVMGLGPVPSIRKALKHAGIKLSEIEAIELNEAFAAQSIGVIKELSEEHGISEEDLYKRTNQFGGAIAIGHPVGASGNRIIVTLINVMKKNNYKYGLASLCIGGGQGTTVILKNVE